MRGYVGFVCMKVPKVPQDFGIDLKSLHFPRFLNSRLRPYFIALISGGAWLQNIKRHKVGKSIHKTTVFRVLFLESS